ncbi:MAG: hypothetical protein GWM98_06330 [Nitrospinaceae bacterium]|nr:hypothetical protein [Nitrospinaceae bacterium]NIR54176.1 hypothetical protein [Nitrospinaceae bacterium]NIS84594.1 hypothetical protein [Nitrospinaceae bacterium]NIT81386.1 hypothetical protein [Nitrospinaceae bacterium]NIU43673.1 hypothetical protein [Nitrospinaceae bacterium]
MTGIKNDLICEIIRLSQTHFLEKKGWGKDHSEACEKSVMDWVKYNAREYRDYYKNQLESFTRKELSKILKILDETDRDLNDILNNKVAAFIEKSGPSH